MTKRMKTAVMCVFASLVAFALAGCGEIPSRSEPVSASGVKQASVQVHTDDKGMTTEQHNIADRLSEDNKPGSIKHLYVISAYSGQVIIYSTVRGKVTSGGKRLTPTTVAAIEGEYIGSNHNGMPVTINGELHYTPEVIQDDGTYGTSDNYLYWWDTRGVYHQHYVSGGQIVHISSQPLVVKGIIINMELTPKSAPAEPTPAAVP